MRLKQHIVEATEELDLDNINGFIHKNCKQYLSLLNHKRPLLRGMNRGMQDDPYVGIKNVRKDRMPYGMSAEEAKFLNDWLQKNGHARRDRSVICTSDSGHVDTFGDPFMIFPLDPISKYTWFWSQDLNIDGDAGWEWKTIMAWMRDKQGNATDIQKNTLSRLKMPFEDFFTTNSGLDEAYKRKYEIWFDCKQYYYVLSGDWSKWDAVKQMVVK